MAIKYTSGSGGEPPLISHFTRICSIAMPTANWKTGRAWSQSCLERINMIVTGTGCSVCRQCDHTTTVILLIALCTLHLIPASKGKVVKYEWIWGLVAMFVCKLPTFQVLRVLYEVFRTHFPASCFMLNQTCCCTLHHIRTGLLYVYSQIYFLALSLQHFKIQYLSPLTSDRLVPIPFPTKTIRVKLFLTYACVPGNNK